MAGRSKLDHNHYRWIVFCLYFRDFDPSARYSRRVDHIDLHAMVEPLPILVSGGAGSWLRAVDGGWYPCCTNRRILDSGVRSVAGTVLSGEQSSAAQSVSGHCTRQTCRTATLSDRIRSD